MNGICYTQSYNDVPAIVCDHRYLLCTVQNQLTKSLWAEVHRSEQIERSRCANTGQVWTRGFTVDVAVNARARHPLGLEARKKQCSRRRISTGVSF